MITQMVTGGEDTGLCSKEPWLGGQEEAPLSLGHTHWPHSRPEPAWYSPSIPDPKHLPGFLVSHQILSHIGLSPSAP